MTATVIIDLTSPGTLPPGDLSLKPRPGPWTHGVAECPYETGLAGVRGLGRRG
jgi:hypothetical protein